MRSLPMFITTILTKWARRPELSRVRSKPLLVRAEEGFWMMSVVLLVRGCFHKGHQGFSVDHPEIHSTQKECLHSSANLKVGQASQQIMQSSSTLPPISVISDFFSSVLVFVAR